MLSEWKNVFASDDKEPSLNPYCNGTCSRSRQRSCLEGHDFDGVLILIVMEHALGVGTSGSVIVTRRLS